MRWRTTPENAENSQDSSADCFSSACIQALGFQDAQAIPLPERPESGATATDPPALPLLPPQDALAHLPQRRLSAREQEDWSCGRRITPGADQESDAVVVLSEEGRMLGLGVPDGTGGLQPKVVFEARG